MSTQRNLNKNKTLGILALKCGRIDKALDYFREYMYLGGTDSAVVYGAIMKHYQSKTNTLKLKQKFFNNFQTVSNAIKLMFYASDVIDDYWTFSNENYNPNRDMYSRYNLLCKQALMTNLPRFAKPAVDAYTSSHKLRVENYPLGKDSFRKYEALKNLVEQQSQTEEQPLDNIESIPVQEDEANSSFIFAKEIVENQIENMPQLDDTEIKTEDINNYLNEIISISQHEEEK